MVVVAVLAAVSITSFNGAQKRNQSTGDTARLTALQAAGRSVVALSGATVPLDIVSRLPADGLKIVSGPSASGGEISVARLSSTRIAYVVVNGTGCQGIIDDISTNITMWVVDTTATAINCDASRLGLTAPVAGTTLLKPQTFDFDTTITVPGAPATPSVAVSGSTALVSFYAPTSNGGSGITEYTAVCSPNGNGTVGTTIGARSPVSVTGLTAGETYSCTVKAANVRGYGAASLQSDDFRPVNAPNSPAGVLAQAGDSKAIVTWSKLTSSVDAPIAGYRVYANGVMACQAVGDATQTCTATGLTNGVSYTIQVVAYYETTEGAASSAVIVIPRRVPGPPTSVTIGLTQASGSTVAEVSFNEPADDGGSILVGYRAICTSTNGGVAGSATALVSPATVTGLTTGKSYTCTVAAQNDAGYGAESVASSSFVSSAPPGQPTSLVLVGSSTTVTLSFVAPASNGGLNITLYRGTCLSSNGGDTMTGTSATSPVVVQNLTAGKTYTCSVAAQTGAGFGAESAASSAYTAFNIPGAITALTPTPGNQQVALSWAALTTSTSNPVEGYRVYRNGVLGCQISGSGSTSCTVTGLTNGTSYSFQVLAYYSTVEGALSSAVVSTPLTVASAPTNAATTAVKTTAAVTFTASASNGGATITSYRATCTSSNGGTTSTGTATASPVSVTALSASKSYTCTVAAQNAAGWSAESSASTAFVPLSEPSAPTSPVVAVDKMTATVSFVPSSFNGGATITSYRATCTSSNGGTTKTATAVSTPVTVTLLSAAKDYSCTVAAQNSQGWSSESSASTVFVPYTTSNAPGTVTPTAGTRSITATFSTPAFNGGSAVIEYRLTCTNTSTTVATNLVGYTSPITLSDLAAAKGHTCTVAARNAAGWGVESTPTATVTPYDVADAPTNAQVTPSASLLSVSFTPGASNNGMAVTRYRATCASSNGGVENEGFALTSPVTVGALTSGKLYTCTVAAENAAGWSAESAPSTTVTPYTVPSAPTSVTLALTRGTGSAFSVSATPGADNGRAITKFRASCTNVDTLALTTAESATLPVTVQNLTARSVYTCTVAAQNLAGWSAESAASASMQAFPAPGTPLVPEVVADNTFVSVFWTPLATTDSTPISGYRVYKTPSGGSATLGCQSPGADSNSCDITGLTNGVTYTFNLVAYYSDIEGDASSGVQATPRTIPNAPTPVTATYGDSSVALTWAAFFNGGSAVTDYLVEYSTNGGTTWVAFNDGVSAPASITVSGLTNGTSYVFRVAAVNVAGTSAWSATSAAAVPKRAPNAPTSVTGQPAGSGMVTLQWVASSDIGGSAITTYQTRESNDNGVTWATPVTTSSTTTTFTRTGLIDGQTYLFQVRAVNAAGAGAWSASSAPINTIQTPDAPTNLIVRTSSTDGVATWDTVISSTIKPFTGYRLFQNGVQVCQTATPTCALTGLTAGTAYAYTIASYGTAGQGTLSAAQNITSLGIPTALAATWQSTASLAATWAAPTGTGNSPITGYSLRYRITGAPSWTTATPTASPTTLTSLTVGSPYEMQIAAMNAIGTGTYSTLLTKAAPTVPTAPTNLTWTAAYGQVALSWTVPSSNGGLAISDYTITATAPDGSPGAGVSGQLTRTLGSTGTTFTYTGLTNGYSYMLSVGAINGVGTSPLVTTTAFTVPYVPIGSVVAYAGSTTPAGWLEANGAAVSRSTYAQLFAAVGTQFGAGDGSTTFTMPDTRGRVIAAQDAAQTQFDVRGELGGASSRSITAAQMPSHAHGASHGHGMNDPGHAHGQNAEFTVAVWWGGGMSAIPSGYSGWGGYGGAHWFTIYGSYTGVSVNTTYADAGYVGSGSAHNELQPYRVVRYLVATNQTSSIVPGMMVSHAGSNTPTGWASANAAAVSRSTFSTLFSNISTTYGAGDGSTTFALPDMRGRSAAGMNAADAQFNVLGMTGGTKTETLTTAQLPSHTHSYSHNHNVSDPSHGHGSTGSWTISNGQGSGVSGVPAGSSWWGSFGNAHWYTIYSSGSGNSVQTMYGNTGGAGSTTAHNNLQPYLTTQYLVATNATTILQPGMYLSLAASTTPSSMPQANGQAVSRTTYGGLFTALGTTYGAGNGSTTFTLPNAAGRVLVQQDTSAEFDTLGETGGANTVTLTEAQMPSHSHDMSHGHVLSDPGHSHSTNGSFTIGYIGGGGMSGIPGSYPTWGGYGPAHWWTIAGNATGVTVTPYSFNTVATGGSTAHDNLQPYVALPQYLWTGVTETLAQLAAPANLAATASSTTANVTWSTLSAQYNNPVVGYRVMRNGVLACQTTLTTCSITGLTAGSTYSLQVAAYGQGGQGALSSSISLTTLGIPTASAVIWTTTSAFSVSWTAPATTGNSAVTGYIVEYKTTAASTWTSQNAASSPAVVSVGAFGSYSVRVSAVNAVGVGSPGTEVSVVAPSVPTAVQSATAIAADSSVRLAWSAPLSNGNASLTQYVIDVLDADGGQAAGVTGATTRTTAVGTTSLIFTGLTNGYTYSFRIAAQTAAGIGAYSNIAAMQLQALPAGLVAAFAASTTPSGWLLADGQAVSRTTYSTLFSIIGTQYGTGDGSTTFNLPNLKGRALVELDSAQTEFDVLGETGGTKTETLTTAQMPSHTHIQDAHNHSQDAHTHGVNDPSHAHGQYIGWGGGGYVLPYWDGNTGRAIYGGATAGGSATGVTVQAATPTNNATTATNNATGGGLAHNNLQSYSTFRYYISATSTTAVQPGMLVPSVSSTVAQSGWLTADGSLVSRSTYSALFASTSTSFGVGDGSTTFAVPDLRGRIPVGLDATQTEFDALGETGGTKSQVLTTSELPSHNHTQSSHNHTQNAHGHSLYDAGHAHSQYLGWGGGGYVLPYWDGNTARAIYGGAFGNPSGTGVSFQSTTATNIATTATNQNTGGGTGHNNLQPYMATRYLVAADSTSRLLPGMLVHYAAEEVLPTDGTTGGWLMADGTAVSRSANSALFSAVGTAFGAGDGSTTFALPSPKGRVLAGMDTTQVEFDLLGETGGAKTVTLTSAQMPSHTHSQNSHNHTQNAHSHGVSDPGHSHQQYNGWGGGGYVLPYWDGNTGRAIYGGSSNGGNYSYLSLYNSYGTNQAATPTNTSAGSDTAHNEVQPYIAMNLLVHGGSVAGSQLKPTNTYAVPAGTVVWYAGTTAPTGWLAANGAAVSRMTYSTLFSATSTTYGAGNGSTTFNLPNLSGRSIVGRDTTQTEFDVLGEVGGVKTVALTAAQMPSHTHIQDAHNHVLQRTTDGVFTNTSGSGVQFRSNNFVADTVGFTTATNQTTGGGAAHNNLQPYIALTAIVATGVSSAFGPGMVIATTNSTTPTGWALADGAALSRTTAAELFTVAGSTFGAGDGSTTFNLPNLNGRLVVGRDTTQTEFDVLGEVGGVKTVALTIAQMPSHTHIQDAHNHVLQRTTDGVFTNTTGSGVQFRSNAYVADTVGFTTATNQTTGGGAAHNNLAPYQAVRYLVATASRLDIASGFLLNAAATAAPSGSYTSGPAGRFAVGVSASDTEFDVLGETGGTKTETLTTAQMPSHTHIQDPHNHGESRTTNGVFTNTTGSGVQFRSNNFVADSVGFTTATNQTTGGGAAHNNLQPYIALQQWSYAQTVLRVVSSSTTANIAWEPTSSALNAGIAAYRVFRNGVQVCQTTATTCTLSDLTAGTTYTWQIAPISGAGQGALSSAVVSTTLSMVVVAPVVVPSASNATLSWAAPVANGDSAVTSYDYRVSTDNGTTWSSVINTGNTGVSVALSTLTATTAYVFQVRAVNGIGPGTWSATTAPVVTFVPTLAAFGSRRTNLITQPSFEQAPVTGFGAAAVTKDRSTDFARTGTASWKTTMSSTTDNAVAYYTAGSLTQPSTGTFTVSAYYYIPSGSILAGRTITLSLEGGTFTGNGAVASIPATLVAGSWARASRTVTFSAIPTTHPAVVARISDLTAAAGSPIYTDDWLYESGATPAAYFDGNSASSFWTGTTNSSTSQQGIGTGAAVLTSGPVVASGISDYAVQYKASASPTWLTYNDGTSSAQTNTLTGLTNLTAYDFRIAAVSSGAQGLWSNIASATPNDLPSATGTPTATVQASNVQLTWTAPAYVGTGITNYELSVLDQNNAASIVPNNVRLTNSTAVSYTFTDLPRGGTYKFRIRALNAAGYSENSWKSSLVFVSGVPLGMVVAYAGSTTPTGWVAAEGAAISRSTFSDLFTAIGTQFGAGDGSTTFNVPNLKGRSTIGQDTTQGEFDVLGETGGTKTETITAAQMPSHTHTQNAHNHSQNAHGHSFDGGPGAGHTAVTNFGGGTVMGVFSFAPSHIWTTNGYGSIWGTEPTTAGNAAETATNLSTGGNAAHTNIKPYIALRWLMASSATATFFPGMLVPTSAASTPTGWVAAEGTAVSRATYADIFAAIGTTYGAGDGSTTFNLPNLKGRTVVGQDTTQGEFDVLGETGGAKTVALTEAQMPSHTHAQNSHNHSQNGHEHQFDGGPGGHYSVTNFNCCGVPQVMGVFSFTPSVVNGAVGYGGVWFAEQSTASNNAETATNQATGSSGAHTNLQPYMALRWMVATSTLSAPQAGMVGSLARSTLPGGWTYANGTAVSRTSFSDLFAAVGTGFGAGDGSTTFGTPNLSGRTTVGQDTAQGEFDVLGETGGVKNVTLSLAEMPSHTHGQSAHNHAQGSHGHTARTSGYGHQGTTNFGGGTTWANFSFSPTNIWTHNGYGGNWKFEGATASNNAATASNQNTGGGTAHNNLHPYLSLRQVVFSGAPVAQAAQAAPAPESATIVLAETRTEIEVSLTKTYSTGAFLTGASLTKTSSTGLSSMPSWPAPAHHVTAMPAQSAMPSSRERVLSTLRHRVAAYR